jgi:hypothetical protein
LRFGADEKRPNQDFNNTELLQQEINDFLGVLELLEENDVILTGGCAYSHQQCIDKKEKVKKYMQYSRERKCLD